jgi:prepilin-type N-terminal cleavage/methylation domain-containing protein
MKLKKVFNKKAFTLVELVVVIAIMAILAGAVAGAVVGLRENANKTEAQDAASTISEQWELLAAQSEITSSTSAANVATKLKAKLKNIDVVSGTATSTSEKYAVVAGTGNSQTITIYTKTKKVVCTCNYDDAICKAGSVSNK